jgi:hypothetical protein
VALVLEGAAQEFPRLEHLRVDQGYTRTGNARDRRTTWMERRGGQASAKSTWRMATVWFEWVRIAPEPKKFRGPLPRCLGSGANHRLVISKQEVSLWTTRAVVLE